jgi:vitamin B12/bleomycin/antimicrobial peptide transport system ATP-binding/permease protein
MKPITWRIFWNEVKPWFVSEEKTLARTGVIALVLMSFFSVYMGVIMNEWSKDFYNTISDKNLSGFKTQVLRFIPILILLIIDFCTRQYFTAWYSFRWRRWKTELLQNHWLDDKHYYKMRIKNQIVDNPDQRIANDISQVTYGIIGLFQTFFRDGVNFFTFATILWGISNTIPMEMFGIHIDIPGFLLWAAIVYSAFGIIITFKVGRPIIDLDRQQEKCEADFRYGLMRINERREEIATFSGEDVEKSSLKSWFIALTSNYYQILKRTIYINLFQNFYLNVQMFIPLFIVGPAYFGGAITMGILMQIRGMFGEVSNSLMTMVYSYNSIASLIASMQRVANFKEQIDSANDDKIDIERKDYIEIKNLQLTTPDGKRLWAVPHIHVKKGEHKLLMAPSGCGKTSLLRVMSGLSSMYSGDSPVVPKDMMFVPQRPYMPVGTLRTCLSYPYPDKTDGVLIPLMKKTHLDHLIPMLDITQDFQQTLSVGEQQRVNFVRILLHKPKWLMIDEPISNLNKTYIDNLCILLKEELKDSGMLIITHSKLPYFDEIITDEALNS